MKGIAFSKDRACQLDALLRSLDLHAGEPVDVAAIVKATTPGHERAYAQLQAEHPRALLVPEGDFEQDFRHLLGTAGEHVLLVVDDTIFVRRWSPAECAQQLDNDEFPDVLGVSLRLGWNTRYCYPAALDQRLPTFHQTGWSQLESNLYAWDWTGADGDFGYPLEVSSSVFRAADILAAMNLAAAAGMPMRNPNELEHALATVAPAFASSRPWLMAYEQSVAFSCPCNRVQSTYANRAGSKPARSAEALLRAWQEDCRIDVEALAGYVPRGAHEEAPLTLVRR